MADDFTQRFQYGLNNLPDEPPDDPNILFSPNGFTSIGTQRAAQAQVVPAQFRNSVRRMWPPGSYPGQGGGLAPGGGPVTEIPVPDWWKTWGPVLPEILRSLHPGVFMDRALSGPDDSVYPMAASGRGRRPSASQCKQEWADARDYCAKELAKPFPDKYRTGGHTDVEGCAAGRVSEPCGGNEKAAGYRSGDKNSKKGGDPPGGETSKKSGSSPKTEPRRNRPIDVDPDDVPSIVPE